MTPGRPAPPGIHIIGGPGSGKTTLAARLAQALDVPTHDLDALAYRNGSRADYRPTSSLPVRLRELREIVARPGWITEGSHLWWTDELLQAAQTVVWLDVSWTLAFRRIIRRHLQEVSADPRHRPRLRTLLGFLRWAWRYYHSARGVSATPADVDDVQAVTRSATACCLARCGDRVVHLHNPNEVESWMEAMAPGGEAPVLRSGLPDRRLSDSAVANREEPRP